MTWSLFPGEFKRYPSQLSGTEIINQCVCAPGRIRHTPRAEDPAFVRNAFQHLAAVAFSKIALYISVFGFTPKRLQSAWLVTVLFAGC